MISNRRGFTLVELLVVVAMIALITGAMSTAITGARERARIQKALADVKTVSQAILSYENYEQGGGNFELPLMNGVDADSGSLGFLIGQGGSAKSGGNIPVLLQARLSGGKKMLDPWGTPYGVTIKEVQRTPKIKTASGSMQTGYYLPNYYRLTEGEK